MTEIDWIAPSREADAWIAEHVFGYETVGLVWASPDPSCGGWDVVWSGQTEHEQPAYVAHCCCDLGRRPDDNDYGDHFAGCLRVVPFYTRDAITTRLVLDKIQDAPRFIDALCTEVYVEPELFYYDSVRWASYTALWALITASPLAICHAAYLAMREEG